MNAKERREKMFELVEKWQTSGKSQREFAMHAGIKAFTFRYWINQYRRQEGINSGFVQLESQTLACISIHYPNGTVLQLPATTPLSSLRALLNL